MTNTPNTTPEPDWPTNWHMIDSIQGVEVKQIHPNHFVLRNASHEVNLDKEGFNVYRTSHKDFEKFLDENLVESLPRTDNGN